MASGEFVCKLCKKVYKPGLFSSSGKYKCPNHGFICANCVTTYMLKSATCNTCNEKVVTYTLKNNKWSQ
jgi:hypothetical protein